MKCRNCGWELSGEDVFCPGCGSKVEADEQDISGVPQNAFYEQKDGAAQPPALGKGAILNGQDAYDASTMPLQEAAANEQNTPVSSNARRSLIAVGIIAAVVVMLAAAAIVILGGKEKTEEAVAAAASSVSNALETLTPESPSASDAQEPAQASSASDMAGSPELQASSDLDADAEAVAQPQSQEEVISIIKDAFPIVAALPQNKTLLAPVMENDQWGFIDTSGKYVIEPQYDDANSFNCGIAPVQKAGKWGYIDGSGKTVIPCVMNYVSSVNNGMAYVFDNSGLYLVDFKAGNVTRPPVEIPEYIEPEIAAYKAFEDAEGKMNLEGCDASGEAVYRLRYDPFHKDGYACVQAMVFEDVDADEYYSASGAIDKKGNTIIPISFAREKSIYLGNELFVTRSDDYVEKPIFTIRSKDLELDTQFVKKNRITDMLPFDQGLAGVISESGKQGFIDKDFNFVIPLSSNISSCYAVDNTLIYGEQYSYAEDGKIDTKNKRTAYGLMDYSGNKLTPAIYGSTIIADQYNRYCDMELIRVMPCTFATSASNKTIMLDESAQVDERVIYIDRTGNTIFSFPQDTEDEYTGHPARNGYAIVEKNGEYGFVSTDGLSIDYRFADAGNFSHVNYEPDRPDYTTWLPTGKSSINANGANAAQGTGNGSAERPNGTPTAAVGTTVFREPNTNSSRGYLERGDTFSITGETTYFYQISVRGTKCYILKTDVVWK